MRVALIARSTLYSVKGGDTVQVDNTARGLQRMGVAADIRLACDTINYNDYDLLHFFNITRPADILKHTRHNRTPFVVSPVFVDYSEYDGGHRVGFAGKLFSLAGRDGSEYIKTTGRWLLGRDRLVSSSYLWKGQRRSIAEVLSRCAMLLPNSQSEYHRLSQTYTGAGAFRIIPNGVDENLFHEKSGIERKPALVICAARIEGIKNQLNLIRALNDTSYELVIIGAASPGQQAYYRECRRIAAPNVRFTGQLTQEMLLEFYSAAKVHVLPSWFETTGLSSLEAAAMGCHIVISNRGDAPEYFGNDAFYCDPSSPGSIRNAIECAAAAPANTGLQQRILASCTWQQATRQTCEAYRQAMLLCKK